MECSITTSPVQERFGPAIADEEEEKGRDRSPRCRRRPGRGSPFSTFRNRFLLLAAVPAFSFPLPRQHTRGACVEEGEGSVSLGVRSVKEP